MSGMTGAGDASGARAAGASRPQMHGQTRRTRVSFLDEEKR